MAITDRVQHVRGSQSQVDAKQLQDGQIGVVEDKGNERLIFGTISGTNIKVPNQADLDTIQQDVNSAIDTANTASQDISQALTFATNANTLATNANAQSISTQNQVANIIATAGNGTIPTEMVDDRTDANGVVHTTIKQRSDSDYNNLSGKIGNLSNAGLSETDLATAIKNDRIDIQDNATNIGNLSGLNTTAKTDLVSATNEIVSNKVDTSQVVTTPTPNKILQMDDNGDLPTDITGNSASVGGYSVGNGSGKIPLNNGTVNTNLNADLLDGNQANAFALLSNFTNSLNTNGHITIPCSPNPLIIQWGGYNVNPNNSATTVTFPINFPHACLQVVATLESSNATAVTVASINSTTFQMLQGSGSTLLARFIAIGY